MHENILRFAERYQLEIRDRLGFGIHGSVFEVIDRRHRKSAVKIHNEREHFFREFEVYERLDEHGVVEICGFWVPQLLRMDEDFLALQMTMVARPFVLDFAGAYVDSKPSFPEEIWNEWENQKREQFGDKWRKVREILDSLEEMGIYYVDVSPSNVAFRD